MTRKDMHNRGAMYEETSETVQVVAPGSERDFEGELRRLRESLEAQVRAAQAEAEKQRRRAEEARAVMAQICPDGLR